MDFIHIGLIDIIDIFVVAVILFYVYRITRGTHVPSILTGIIIIYALWLLVRAFDMELLSSILGQVIGVGIIALIVIFQPDIRRFLQLLGGQGKKRQSTLMGRFFSGSAYRNQQLEYITPVVKACKDMSATKTGALIVIKARNDLSTIAETGIIVDARVSSSMLKSIFFKNSPLHDGAVIISEGRIEAARCVLPVTEQEMAANLGMRHRSALGMSEVSDATVVVVSEETGSISFTRNGELVHDISPTQLKTELLLGINR